MDGDFRNQKLVKPLEFEECDDIADLAEALSPDSVSPTTAGQQFTWKELPSAPPATPPPLIRTGLRKNYDLARHADRICLFTTTGDEGMFGINGYIERAFSEITFGFDDCD